MCCARFDKGESREGEWEELGSAHDDTCFMRVGDPSRFGKPSETLSRVLPDVTWVGTASGSTATYNAATWRAIFNR